MKRHMYRAARLLKRLALWPLLVWCLGFGLGVVWWLGALGFYVATKLLAHLLGVPL